MCRQCQCESCYDVLCYCQSPNDARAKAVEKSSRLPWASVFVRVAAIYPEQVCRRAITASSSWRPRHSTDAQAFRDGWYASPSRLIPVAPVRRASGVPETAMLPGTGRGLAQVGNATGLPADGPDWSCGAQAEVDGSSSSPSGSRLAPQVLVQASVGYQHDSMPTLTPTGGSMGGDAPSQPSLATRRARNQRLTHFPFDASAMENGGAIRARRMLEEYECYSRTIGARALQWKCYRIFCLAEGRALAPVTEQQLIALWAGLRQSARLVVGRSSPARCRST
jgi:hypothetical protein